MTFVYDFIIVDWDIGFRKDGTRNPAAHRKKEINIECK